MIRKTISNLLYPTSAIPPADTLHFFPTCAHQTPDGHWRLPIHGWIYRPTELSRLRTSTLKLVKSLTHLRHPKADLFTPLFTQRLGAFLSDNDRGRRIQIQFHNNPTLTFPLKKSHPSGHIHTHLEITSTQIESHAPAKISTPTWLTYRALTSRDDPRTFEGRILLLPPEGLSIISDIDDTIKITEVLDRRRMLANTFLREFICVPGMSDYYIRLATTRNAAFHYVSASPWHLYPFLAEFLAAQKFPAGTFHLRNFRLTPRGIPETLRSAPSVKHRHLKQLLTRYPRRRFILIGDSGESDAKLYAHLARKFPTQIEKIYIRNITNDSHTSPRNGSAPSPNSPQPYGGSSDQAAELI